MLGCNYLLLDGARIGQEIISLKENFAQHGKSLYLGKSKEDLEDVGPFLFKIDSTNNLTNWFEETGWGNAFGVLVFSNIQFEDLFRHCRKFLLVRTEDQQELYFRFYDPRVLRIFLPTCTSVQLREFFGPIDFFMLEDEDPNYVLKFQIDRDKLKSSRFHLEDIASKGLSDATPVDMPYPIEESVQPNVEHLDNSFTRQQQSNNNLEESSIEKPKKKWNDFFFN